MESESESEADFSAQNITLIITRGDTLPLEVHIVDDVEAPVPLLGSTLIFTVIGADGIPIFSMTPYNVGTTEYDVQGVVRLQSAPGATDIAKNIYLHYLQWTYGAVVRTLIAGKFIVVTG